MPQFCKNLWPSAFAITGLFSGVYKKLTINLSMHKNKAFHMKIYLRNKSTVFWRFVHIY